MNTNTRISIIIPAINEENCLGATLAALTDEPERELIVVDGGSTDATRQIALDHGGTVIESEPGRAAQMNRGAAAASGGILLFLHADTLLPQGFGIAVRRCLATPDVAAGAFGLTIDAPGTTLRLIEKLTNLRSRFFQTPYGDQGLFVKASLFRKIGGFPETPLFEDLLLARRLTTAGRVVTLPERVATSARRWTSNGPLRTTLFNQFILLGFWCGISPARLARLYRNFGRRDERRQ